MIHEVPIEMTKAAKDACYERGIHDFSHGKSCNENPYKLLWMREQWFKGFLNQKRIVYRERAAKGRY